MNYNRNKKNINSSNKKSFNKTSNTNAKFGGKKKYFSKDSFSENEEYSKKFSTKFGKKVLKKQDILTNGKKYKPQNNDNGKYYTKKVSEIATSTDSKFKKTYNKEEKAYSSINKFGKKLIKHKNIVENDLENKLDKHYNKETRLRYATNIDNKPINKKKMYSESEKSVKTFTPYKKEDNGAIRLNKYIANSGICSRREADELIISGAVKVNGKIVTELGIKVLPTDEIQYGGETLRNEKNVYLLLNKPKDFITTSDDPFNRKTVMSLVQKACKERIYPVGRLDRMTTGLLLFTNDGELAKKLTHPKHNIKKIYQVELDKPLSKTDMLAIQEGIELEDGAIKADVITYVGDGVDKKTIGIELHSGKNRIVRRIFEHFGYNVAKLDRVYFAGLTKKDLPRGKHRFLTEAEINMLKIIS